MAEHGRPVLLYDAACRLCRFTARVAARLSRPGELDILPLQDPAADAFLSSVPPAERLATWRIALPGGELAGEGAGVPQLLVLLGRTRVLGRLLGLLPDGVLDAGYRFVAGQRRRLGRLVPDGDAPRRSG
jgi:predicted DCC family thiol-disulfide oxidoreductase YuxK